MSVGSPEIKAASEYTKRKNRILAERLGIDGENTVNSELELANKDCILPLKDYKVVSDDGRVIFDNSEYSFFEQKKAPDTVNPSLWINGKSNYAAGVFEVLKDKIYQVRGLDCANFTIVRSKTGWIVLDTTTFAEVAADSLKLLEKALGEPVKEKIRAIIVSHSHADHFGGLAGTVDEAKVGKISEGKIPIIVPAGFDEETVKENVFAGFAMGVRARYQFGGGIPAGVTGKVSVGLGTPGGRGTLSYIRPTEFISEDTVLNIDGLDVEFQLTPGTEAPAEMNNYFPEYRAFWAAENCSGTLHNVYPIRGAQLRDAAAWWRFTEIALEKYGVISDVVFQAHNHHHRNTPENPTAVTDYLRNNAAIYKIIHDNTLLYANIGKTAKQAAKLVKIPYKLQKAWYIRPYYGSVEINSRAVYTKYLGFWNGDPNEINPLTEEEEAKLFLRYAGSAENVLKLAKEDFENGRYEEAAKAAGYVVFAEPDNLEARYLQADAFEQLGYSSESSVWRNAYLSGAGDLRKLSTDERKRNNVARGSLVEKLTPRMLLDYLGIITDSTKLSEENRKFRLVTVDPLTAGNTDYKGKKVRKTTEFSVHIYYGSLLYYEGHTDEILKTVVVPEKALPLIVDTGSNAFLDAAETDIPEVIDIIRNAIVDVVRKAEFPMIEPNKVVL